MYKPIKRERETNINFNEYDDWIFIQTFNTDLKKRLKKFAEEKPDICFIEGEYTDGMLECDILKANFSFRISYPISDERKNQLSENGKMKSGNLIKKS